VKRHGVLALAALLAAGILMARGAAWLRTRGTRAGDPASRLPSRGLLITFRGDDLGARVSELARFPLYRELIGSGMTAKIRRVLRWGASVPDPWEAVPSAGTSALGVYRKGWTIVTSAAGTARVAISREEGGWRLLASDVALLPRPGDPRKGTGPRLARGEMEIDVDVPGCVSAAAGARREWEPLLPQKAVGRLRADRGRLQERWEIACGDGCLLDLLDAHGAAGAEARGWPAIPDSAEAVAWFLLDPLRLADAGAPRPGAEAFSALTRLGQIEQFVGIPVRREMASALAGPGVVALIDGGGEEDPRPLLALDLADPDRARRALYRVTALGVLSGAIRESSYRGVPIASWAAGGRRVPIEPAAAVDAGLLLLALRRADIADAIDRLRAATPSGGSGGLRKETAALARGAWKAASRSASLTRAWERILGGEAPPSAAPDAGVTRAVLRKEGNRWILDASGSAPALALEPLLPSLRRIFRTWPDRERR
jgi:hypothetical protein